MMASSVCIFLMTFARVAPHFLVPSRVEFLSPRSSNKLFALEVAPTATKSSVCLIVNRSWGEVQAFIGFAQSHVVFLEECRPSKVGTAFFSFHTVPAASLAFRAGDTGRSFAFGQRQPQECNCASPTPGVAESRSVVSVPFCWYLVAVRHAFTKNLTRPGSL